MQNTKFPILIIYITLIGAFILNLDPNGGAFKDFQYHSKVSQDFSIDFKNTFFNYDIYSTRHSPVFLIFMSLFYKIGLSENLIRLFFLHIGLFLPFIFYKCLKLKYSLDEKKNIIFFSCIVLLSPSFWSLTIWPDSRIFGLVLFCISIYYFLKFNKKRKFKNTVKCIIFYTISSYLSPNFCVFSFFYFFYFLQYYKLGKEIIAIIIINLLLAAPAVLYIFSLNDLFFLKTAVPSSNVNLEDFYNIQNKILTISSIMLFYLLPFIIIEKEIFNFKNIKILIFSFILLLILSLNFNYNYEFTGGGIFFKLSNYLFGNNILFFLSCFISFVIILNLIIKDKANLILYLLLIIANPQYTVYHKYYDPFLIILFTTIFNVTSNKNVIFKNKSLLVFYLHMISFLILNFIK